jgi:hypothetical protein
MADVVIEGVRLMGQSTLAILVRSSGNDIGTLVIEITAVASLGGINENYHAVRLTGIEQLTTLTLALLQSDTHDIGFAAEKRRIPPQGLVPPFWVSVKPGLPQSLIFASIVDSLMPTISLMPRIERSR